MTPHMIDHLGYDCYGNVAIAGGVTINNITNVTHVNVLQANGRATKLKHRSDGGHNRDRIAPRKHTERKPALFRFVASCGVIDQDKAVQHLDNGTFGREMLNCLSYTSRDLSHNAQGIGRGVCQIGRAVGTAIGSVFGLVAKVLE